LTTEVIIGTSSSACPCASCGTPIRRPAWHLSVPPASVRSPGRSALYGRYADSRTRDSSASLCARRHRSFASLVASSDILENPGTHRARSGSSCSLPPDQVSITKSARTIDPVVNRPESPDDRRTTVGKRDGYGGAMSERSGRRSAVGGSCRRRPGGWRDAGGWQSCPA
jgi:hypothetical protein